MALNSSGPISLIGSITGQSIAKELSLSETAQLSLFDSSVRNLLGVASGPISMFDGYGKSSGFVFNQTISSDTTNYNLKSAAIAAGWDQSKPLIATVTINAGVYVYSTSTGSYAFDTGSSFYAGSTLALINNGTILGRGGDGGQGAFYNSGTDSIVGANRNGTTAGPAFIARYAISVTNNGTIGGGGGGGGGSGLTIY
jgi:hypothetical protein